MSSMEALWKALLRHAHSEFPEFWTRERCVYEIGTAILLYFGNNFMAFDVILCAPTVFVAIEV